MFARLVNETLDWLEAEADIPRSSRPEGWDNWDFRFDQVIPVQLTHMIAQDLQRRLDWIEFVQFGRVPLRCLPQPPAHVVPENSSTEPSQATQTPVVPTSSRARRTRARGTTTATTNTTTRQRRGRGTGRTGGRRRQEETMEGGALDVGNSAGTQGDATTSRSDVGAGRSLRPRSSLRLPTYLNDYVRT